MSDKRAERQAGWQAGREGDDERGNLFEWWQNVLACRQCARQRLHFMCPAKHKRKTTEGAGAEAEAEAEAVAVVVVAQSISRQLVHIL